MTQTNLTQYSDSETTTDEFSIPPNQDKTPEIVVDSSEDTARPTCLNCEASVSQAYARVAGDNLGRVHSCPECSSRHDNLSGGTAGIDRDDGETLMRMMAAGD